MCLTLYQMPGGFCQAGFISGSSPTSCHAYPPMARHGRQTTRKSMYRKKCTQNWKTTWVAYVSMLEGQLHTCRQELRSTSVTKQKTSTHKHREFLIQHSKRVENHGIRSISLNKVCEPTEVAWTLFVHRFLSFFFKNLKILTKPINDNSQTCYASVGDRVMKSTAGWHSFHCPHW